MRRRRYITFPLLLVAALVMASPGLVRAQDASVARAEGLFEKTIAPLLSEHCLQCHGEDVQEGELRLDAFAGIAAGGTSGPVVVPNLVSESLLISAVEYKDEALQMPPEDKLPDSAIAAFKSWIETGAKHPDGDLTPGAVAPPFDVAEARQFWAFQRVRRPAPPSVRNKARVQTPIDAFVLARLEEQGVQPNAAATKDALLRRATFDLTGLPPTPGELTAYLNDDSPQAFEHVVDRLLDSQHYGERWGRHWLDVARYADSNGLDENIAHGNAWRYRDYVIGSFNEDKPFDKFLTEQIAGDLLIADDTSRERRNELLTATGFLSLGPKVLAEGDELKMQMDIVDEQVDTIGKAFLGLTFGCARCHDHKFDPISQADYYAMVGIFKSTRTMASLKRIAKWNENTIATQRDQAQLKQHQQKIDAQKAEIERVRAGATAEQLETLQEELKQLQAIVPDLPTAMGVSDGDVADARVNVRGSHLTLGRRVHRGIPVVFHNAAEVQIATTESGRKELTEWLTDAAHPLTARVIVNRVWRWHFGRGLVATTENFGRLGEAPTHPELLDWLASELVEQGWSLKQLHRTILLSSVYQQSSRGCTESSVVDPENRFWWRFNPRRLEAEEIRDSVLFVSGLLDRSAGGSMLNVGNREFIFDHTSKDNTSYDSFRRSVYLPVIRNNLYDGFSLFDYTDASVPNGDRATSTVAPQALFMMNSELFMHASATLAEQLIERSPDSTERVRQLYSQALGRPASERDVERVLTVAQALHDAFSTSGSEQQTVWTAVCQSVLASNDFVYVE